MVSVVGDGVKGVMSIGAPPYREIGVRGVRFGCPPGVLGTIRYAGTFPKYPPFIVVLGIIE